MKALLIMTLLCLMGCARPLPPSTPLSAGE
jgi:hypothetical protein